MAGGEEQQLTTGYERVLHLFYSPDGRWLYVQPSHRNIFRMPSDGGPLQPVTHFPESGLFIEEPTISPDGRYLLYNRGHGGSSLWMLTIGAASSPLIPGSILQRVSLLLRRAVIPQLSVFAVYQALRFIFISSYRKCQMSE